MVLPRAQSRLATLADQSVRVDAPQGYAFLSGKLQAHLSSNAYYDGNGVWNRYDTAQPAAAAVVDYTGGQLRLYTAPAGANPIAWTITSLGADSGWQAVAFAANWSDFGAGFPTCQVKKDATGRVYVKGMAKKAIALALPETICTLPAGYRPATVAEPIVAPSLAGYAEVRITTAGLVLLQAGGSAGWNSIRADFDPAEG